MQHYTKNIQLILIVNARALSQYVPAYRSAAETTSRFTGLNGNLKGSREIREEPRFSPMTAIPALTLFHLRDKEKKLTKTTNALVTLSKQGS